MPNETEDIILSLPLNAAYVSKARMTASAFALKMGFDFEESEDIKTAVSEACIFVIKRLEDSFDDFNLIFNMKDDVLTVTIETKRCYRKGALKNELSVIMIKALMDEALFQIDELLDNGETQNVKSANNTTIIMTKKHKQFLFG